MNSSVPIAPSPPTHCQQQTGDHESKGDGVVPRPELGQERNRRRRELENQQPGQADDHQAQEEHHEPHARRTGLDLDRRAADRAGGEAALLADLGLGQLSTFTNTRRHGCDDEAGFTYEVNVGVSLKQNATGE